MRETIAEEASECLNARKSFGKNLERILKYVDVLTRNGLDSFEFEAVAVCSNEASKGKKSAKKRMPRIVKESMNL